MEIKDLEKATEEIVNANISEETKRIVLGLIKKEIMEKRSMNQEIKDNIDFYNSK